MNKPEDLVRSPKSIGSRRIFALLNAITGVGIALLAIFADPLLALPHSFGPTQMAVTIVGLSLTATAFFSQYRLVSRLSTIVCLPLLSLIMVWGIGEIFCRVARIDFANEEKAWRAMPPFFRQPTVPMGPVFFRRAGPERWSGQVLNVYVSKLGLWPNSWENEAPVTVEYNQLGFRNPPGLKEWEIAVAGDSFTELGYLPYEELFTTILAKELKTSVLNLGTSYTGPLTQLTYIQNYGVSARTKHVMIMFFEGNDIGDLEGEYGAWLQWKKTGEHQSREFKKQTSLARFLFDRANDFYLKLAPRHRERNVITAYFNSREGKIPVTLAYTPPGRANLSSETIEGLHHFFSEYAAFGKKHGLTVWLGYLPTKERVLYGRLEFDENTLAKIPKLKRLKTWKPSDLPQVMAELCNQYGVRFIDFTPALVQETERKGKLLYNGLNETHLNRGGAAVLAHVLAHRLSRTEPQRHAFHRTDNRSP